MRINSTNFTIKSMQIQWLGQSHFKIQTKNNGDDIIIAIDPYDKDYGLKVSRFQADILLISHNHNDHNNVQSIMGEPFIIDCPGEYETKGVFIYGIPTWHDDQGGKDRGAITMYKITTENIDIAFLSDLGHKLDDKQLDKLGNVDILMIPVGGTFTIDAKTANDIIGDIEPRIIIPMHYNLPGLKFKSGKKLDGIDKFLKISSLPIEKSDKLKITKKDLLQEQTKIVVLNN